MGVDALFSWALEHRLLTFPGALLIVALAIVVRYVLRGRGREVGPSQSIDMKRARVGGNVHIKQEQDRNE
jgi:hypothetical protein